MFYQVKNLPRKEGNLEGRCDGCFLEVINKEEGGLVCSIEPRPLDAVAMELCTIIEESRRIGYEQAKRDIRRAMGLEK